MRHSDFVQASIIHQARHTAVHDQRVRALRAMSPEDRDAWFAKVDATLARCDAIKDQDWQRFVDLGGDIETARKADPTVQPVNSH